MLNRAQRNFRAQMADIQKEEKRKRRVKFFSYIEDKVITSYYDGPPIKVSVSLWFKIIRFLIILAFLAEVGISVLLIIFIEKMKFETSLMFSTGIALTLFLFGLISPRLLFMNSRLLVTVIFGMLTMIFFAFTILSFIPYQP